MSNSYRTCPQGIEQLYADFDSDSPPFIYYKVYGQDLLPQGGRLVLSEEPRIPEADNEVAVESIGESPVWLLSYDKKREERFVNGTYRYPDGYETNSFSLPIPIAGGREMPFLGGSVANLSEYANRADVMLNASNCSDGWGTFESTPFFSDEVYVDQGQFSKSVTVSLKEDPVFYDIVFTDSEGRSSNHVTITVPGMRESTSVTFYRLINETGHWVMYGTLNPLKSSKNDVYAKIKFHDDQYDKDVDSDWVKISYDGQGIPIYNSILACNIPYFGIQCFVRVGGEDKNCIFDAGTLRDVRCKSDPAGSVVFDFMVPVKKI